MINANKRVSHFFFIPELTQDQRKNKCADGMLAEHSISWFLCRRTTQTVSFQRRIACIKLNYSTRNMMWCDWNCNSIQKRARNWIFMGTIYFMEIFWSFCTRQYLSVSFMRALSHFALPSLPRFIMFFLSRNYCYCTSALVGWLAGWLAGWFSALFFISLMKLFARLLAETRLVQSSRRYMRAPREIDISRRPSVEFWRTHKITLSFCLGLSEAECASERI